VLIILVLVAFGGAAVAVPVARGVAANVSKLTVFTDQVVGPPLMGLGVELDPYDTVAPSQINWPLVTQRLVSMRPGFLRVVEPASTYLAMTRRAIRPTGGRILMCRSFSRSSQWRGAWGSRSYWGIGGTR
jgi:hypothetical protein